MYMSMYVYVSVCVLSMCVSVCVCACVCLNVCLCIRSSEFSLVILVDCLEKSIFFDTCLIK